MTFNIGSLVHARGRDWVVVPKQGEDLLAEDLIMLRPLGGGDAEVFQEIPSVHAP